MRQASFRRQARFVVALSLVLPLVALGGPASPSSASRVIRYLGDELDVHIAGVPSEMCVGETWNVVVAVERFGVYEEVSGRARARRSRPYRIRGVPNAYTDVTAQVSNASVIDFVQTQAPYLQGGSLWAQYKLKARKVGSTNVTVEASDIDSFPGSKTVATRVTECDYEVHVFSIWHLNAGRNIVAASSIDTVVKKLPGQPPAGPQSISASPVPEAKHTAVSFEPPCRAVYELAATGAPVFGKLDDEVLKITVRYGRTFSATAVTCGPVSGGTNDPGILDDVDFTMGPEGGADSVAHVLHAPGIGDFSGTTYITVIPIHR